MTESPKITKATIQRIPAEKHWRVVLWVGNEVCDILEMASKRRMKNYIRNQSWSHYAGPYHKLSAVI